MSSSCLLLFGAVDVLALLMLDSVCCESGEEQIDHESHKQGRIPALD
jgi:hypothetical protein